MATTREVWDEQFSTKPCSCVPMEDMSEQQVSDISNGRVEHPQPCGHHYCPYEWCPIGSCAPGCKQVTGVEGFGYCDCACHG